MQHKDLIVAGQRNACVCVTVGRGREEFEFLHADKRWPMTGRDEGKRGSEDEAQRGEREKEKRDRDRQKLRLLTC